MSGPATVVELFRTHYRDAQQYDTDRTTVPMCLARAARDVLAVDGVGIGLADRHTQVPLGASDAAAELAERIQFTVDDGPGWEASRSSLPLWADRQAITRRWSLFADQLLTRTPYRCVVTLPIVLGSERRFSLDLFCIDESTAEAVSVAELAVVAEEIFTELLALDDADILDAPGVAQRHDVWVAVGVVMGRHALDRDDALGLLRAHCLVTDQTLDEMCRQVVAGDIDLADLTP